MPAAAPCATPQRTRMAIASPRAHSPLAILHDAKEFLASPSHLPPKPRPCLDANKTPFGDGEMAAKPRMLPSLSMEEFSAMKRRDGLETRREGLDSRCSEPARASSRGASRTKRRSQRAEHASGAASAPASRGEQVAEPLTPLCIPDGPMTEPERNRAGHSPLWRPDSTPICATPDRSSSTPSLHYQGLSGRPPQAPKRHSLGSRESRSRLSPSPGHGFTSDEWAASVAAKPSDIASSSAPLPLTRCESGLIPTLHLVPPLPGACSTEPSSRSGRMRRSQSSIATRCARSPPECWQPEREPSVPVAPRKLARELGQDGDLVLETARDDVTLSPSTVARQRDLSSGRQRTPSKRTSPSPHRSSSRKAEGVGDAQKPRRRLSQKHEYDEELRQPELKQRVEQQKQLLEQQQQQIEQQQKYIELQKQQIEQHQLELEQQQVLSPQRQQPLEQQQQQCKLPTEQLTEQQLFQQQLEQRLAAATASANASSLLDISSEVGERSYGWDAGESECQSLPGSSRRKDMPNLTVSKGPGGITAISMSRSAAAEAAAEMRPHEGTMSAPSAVKGSSFTWARGEVLGHGSLGTVFKALDQSTGQILAVKEVRIDSRDNADVKFRQALENEISIYKDLHHPRIVWYLGHDNIGSNLYIYLEYMPGGSVTQVLSQFGSFDESLIATYTRDLLQGLEYLHTRNPIVLHRDVKGANILVGLDCRVKLSDFGCSKRTENTMSQSLRGSIPWMAPEVIQQTGYGRRSDVWSLGCVVIEMATARHPWGAFDNPMAAMVKIGMSNNTPPLPETVSELCKDFIRRCTQRDKEARPNAGELLEHDLVRDLIDPG